MGEINGILSKIQKELNCPKGQKNNFGNYNYRKCEDILRAVKKILPAECTLVVSDEIVNVGLRNYIKARAVLVAPDGSFNDAYGWAKEGDKQAGMCDAQLTGSTSSYARKYALGGLFLLDDENDADSYNKGDAEPEVKANHTLDEVGEVLMFLNNQDQEGASNELHTLTGKSGRSQLTNEEINRIMPHLLERKAEIVKDNE
jgi:hypothetical protein